MSYFNCQLNLRTTYAANSTKIYDFIKCLKALRSWSKKVCCQKFRLRSQKFQIWVKFTKILNKTSQNPKYVAEHTKNSDKIFIILKIVQERSGAEAENLRMLRNRGVERITNFKAVTRSWAITWRMLRSGEEQWHNAPKRGADMGKYKYTYTMRKTFNFVRTSSAKSVESESVLFVRSVQIGMSHRDQVSHVNKVKVSNVNQSIKNQSNTNSYYIETKHDINNKLKWGITLWLQCIRIRHPYPFFPS